MNYTDIKNIVYSNSEKTSIDCEVFFTKFQRYLPYTASTEDTEDHGKRIYSDLINKKYGEIQEFKEDPTLYIFINTERKNNILSKIKTTISEWQSELSLDIISDADKVSLINWLKYAKAIRSIDTNQKEIEWPKQPE